MPLGVRSNAREPFGDNAIDKNEEHIYHVHVYTQYVKLSKYLTWHLLFPLLCEIVRRKKQITFKLIPHYLTHFQVEIGLGPKTKIVVFNVLYFFGQM